MAKNVYLYSLRAGLRQDILSKQLGFGANYYTNVENGKSEGSIKFWRAVQDRYNVPDSKMWDLINGRKEL